MNSCLCPVWVFCSLSLPEVHLVSLLKMMRGKVVNIVSEELT